MLQPILDPLDRPAGLARRQSEQDDVRIHALFDTEAAPARWRGDQAELMPFHAERIAGDRVQRERALEIRPDRITAVAGIEVRNDTVGFDRRRVHARIVDLACDDLRRLGELRLRITVLECAFVNDVAAEFLMQHRCR